MDIELMQLLQHPTALVLMTLAGWPIITALLSLAQKQIAERFPSFWRALQAAGFDLPGLIDALKNKPKQ